MNNYSFGRGSCLIQELQQFLEHVLEVSRITHREPVIRPTFKVNLPCLYLLPIRKSDLEHTLDHSLIDLFLTQSFN